MTTTLKTSGETIAEFELIYQVFDADGDGVLTRGEIIEALEVLGGGISPADRYNLLSRINERGVVTRDRFIEWMSQRQDLDVASDLREIFNLIDVDRNGSLSVAEFTQIVRCLNQTASDAEIAQMVKAADLDGNGEIDFEEFITTQQTGSNLKITIAALPAIKKQTARMRAENGVISLDSRCVQNENHALEYTQIYPHAKYIESIYKVFERTTDLVASTLKDGLFPLVLGGDHSTAAGTIAGIKKAFPNRRLGVVWIDAHADIHSPYTTPSGNMHGMPLAVATDNDNLAHKINHLDAETIKFWEMSKALGVPDSPNLDVRDLIYVSVRDTEAAEDSLIAQHRIPVISTNEVRVMGAKTVAQRCLDYLSEVDLIYVTFDVDSMDSTICMGTGTPVPGGLWADEARDLNTALVKDSRVCCWEICEINPVIDTLNTMAENSLGIFQSVVDTIGDRLKKIDDPSDT